MVQSKVGVASWEVHAWALESGATQDLLPQMDSHELFCHRVPSVSGACDQCIHAHAGRRIRECLKGAGRTRTVKTLGLQDCHT